MSNRACLRLHHKEFLAGTSHLTTLEIGAFGLLVMKFWEVGSLPKDERLLARYARLTRAEWAASRDVLLDVLFRKIGGWSTLERSVGFGVRQEARPAIPKALRELVFARDRSRCRYCGDYDGPFELDHILPWSRGGRHCEQNLVVACVPCNRSKGALTGEEFAGPMQ